MHDIFISYSQADRPFAAKLAAALERQGWSVWWDSEIRAGNTYDQVIEDALAASRCAIVVWSATSVKSGWVRAEAEAALDRGILVPVQMEPTAIPLIFRRIHYADLTGWDGVPSAPAFQRLAQDIDAVLGTSPVARPGESDESKASVPRPAPAAATGPARRRGLSGGAIAVVLLLAAVGTAALLVGLSAPDGGAVPSQGETPPIRVPTPAPAPEPKPEPKPEPIPDTAPPKPRFHTFREDREGVEVTVPDRWTRNRKGSVVSFGLPDPLDPGDPSCNMKINMIPGMSGDLEYDTRRAVDALLRLNDLQVVRRTRVSLDRYTAFATAVRGRQDGREQHSTFYTVGLDTGGDYKLLLFAQTSFADERDVCDPIFDRILDELVIR